MWHHGSPRRAAPRARPASRIAHPDRGVAGGGCCMTAVRDVTNQGTAIGQSIPRLDSREKVRGATRYAADIPVTGLLHARLVLSVYAHARITGFRCRAGARDPRVSSRSCARTTCPSGAAATCACSSRSPPNRSSSPASRSRSSSRSPRPQPRTASRPSWSTTSRSRSPSTWKPRWRLPPRSLGPTATSAPRTARWCRRTRQWATGTTTSRWEKSRSAASPRPRRRPRPTPPSAVARTGRS